MNITEEEDLLIQRLNKCLSVSCLQGMKAGIGLLLFYMNHMKDPSHTLFPYPSTIYCDSYTLGNNKLL